MSESTAAPRHGRRARRLSEEEAAALAPHPVAEAGSDQPAVPAVRGAVAAPGADAPTPALRKFGKRARIIELTEEPPEHAGQPFEQPSADGAQDAASPSGAPAAAAEEPAAPAALRPGSAAGAGTVSTGAALTSGTTGAASGTGGTGAATTDGASSSEAAPSGTAPSDTARSGTASSESTPTADGAASATAGAAATASAARPTGTPAPTATIERDADGVELGELSVTQAPDPRPAPRFDGRVLHRPERSGGRPLLWVVWGLIALAIIVLVVLLITGVLGGSGSSSALGPALDAHLAPLFGPGSPAASLPSSTQELPA